MAAAMKKAAVDGSDGIVKSSGIRLVDLDILMHSLDT
tara:strand:+ start:1119 stop:1229 length:111 start_codon:yes stop_codon:yes gene_type:complete